MKRLKLSNESLSRMNRSVVVGVFLPLWWLLWATPSSAANLTEQLANTMQNCGGIPCATVTLGIQTATAPPYANINDNLRNAFQDCSGIPCLTVTGISSGAPTDATYITQTSNGTLTNEQALGSLATGILKNTTTTGVLSIAVAGDFPTLNQNTTGSAATLTTPRAIYGNNFDGSAALTQIIASTYGGTGNGFTKFSGPATSEKTFTLPNANETIDTLGQATTFTALKTFSAGLTVSGGVLTVPAGSIGAPSLTIGDPLLGFYKVSTNRVILRTPDGQAYDFNDGTFGTSLVSGTVITVGGNNDVWLYRDAANTLALRNGTNAQYLHLYKTYTDASNYERLKIWADATNNVFRLDSEAAGTGTVRNIALMGGKFGVNTVSPLTKLTVLDTISTSPRGILSMQISTDTNGALVGLSKARGTEASPTTVVTGDTLGRLMFRGYDGSNYLEMASIEAVSTGTIASTRVPTYLAFSTATDAAPSVLTERMRIDSAGLVTVNYGLTVSAGTFMLPGATLLATSAALTDGAGSSAGTLTNAPAIGNPTKWIPINDNGTTRYIPAW